MLPQPNWPKYLLSIFPLLAMCLALALNGCSPNDRAARHPTKNQYHGTEVVDDYQWLEKGTDAKVQEWSGKQNKRTRAYLDKLPVRRFVQQRLEQLFAETSPSYSGLVGRGNQLFVMKFQPPAQQPLLMTFDSVTNLKSAKVILDPNTLSSDGSTSIDWFVPSRDGKLIAVSLSDKGSEAGTLYVYESATGTKLEDAIPRVQFPTAGGSAAWNADGTGIFYTRYPAKAERPPEDQFFYQQVYFHKLGTPAEQDTYEMGKDLPRIAEIALETSQDGRHLLAIVSNGDGGEYAHYLRDTAGKWSQVTRFEDQVKQAEFGRDPLYIEWGKDDALYVLSTKDAPNGKILRLPLANPDLAKAAVVVPQGTNVIQDFKPSASGLFVSLIHGGPSELEFIDYLNKSTNTFGRQGRGGFGFGPPADGAFFGGGPNFRAPTAIQEMVVTRGDDLLLRTETYTEPFTWWHYNPSRDKERMERTALIGTSPASFEDVETVRANAISKDGTKVPLTIIRRKGIHLNGDNPTILTGYGGYGINLTPHFDFTRRVWLDQGGVIAVANLRGGNEFGEEWHKAGNLTKKQNVFDDFAACAEFLVRSNYTKPSKLAIEGGSNGGLLMGAALTQHPDLMQAVVSHVGIYDMLRVELDPNGAFNVTEFGSVKDPDQFKALYGYSPYHHVANEKQYPAVLLLTGENDGRVNPAHSRKMTARLLATDTRRPVLLRTSSSSGHGMGTALQERIQELADVYAFLFDQLSSDYTLVDRGPWSGAVTPSSARVKAKVAHEGLKTRLALSKTALLTSPQYFGPSIAESNRYNVVDFQLANLQPDTQYYYGLEIDGVLDRKMRGQLKTFPADGPASFTIAFASCARTASTSEVFDRIREHHPIFYMNMGDFHYLNISTNSRPRYRAAYDLVLSSPQQAELYRNIPFVYMWDDHDFGGNDSNKKAKSHEAARYTYQEYVPHYPLAFGGGDIPISQSFNVGRVKFIIPDLRSERDEAKKKDGPEKSMLGAKQKEWFKKELLNANGKFPLICFVSSVPWIGDAGKSPYRGVKTNQFGYIHHTDTNLLATTRTNRNRAPSDEDHWSVYATERREIADFIKSNHISGVCILHGDSHMLAADDGTYSDYATGKGAPIPVMCAAPLDQDPSLKGGPYSQGVFRTHGNEGCFGLLNVTDQGDRIDVAYSGRTFKDEEKISLKFSVPVIKNMAQKN